MSHRLIARTGLAAAILNFTLAIGFLGYQTFSRSQHSVEIGRSVPQFTLPDTAGHRVSLADFKGRAVVLFFGSDQCPVSRQYAAKLAALARSYAGESRVQFLAINSNTRARAASPADLKLIDSDRVPTLLDPMAEVARSFGTSVTPTFCVIDPAGHLRYTGSFDDGDSAPARPISYVAGAVDRTLAGIPVVITSTQAFGRSIAWVK